MVAPRWPLSTTLPRASGHMPLHARKPLTTVLQLAESSVVMKLPSSVRQPASQSAVYDPAWVALSPRAFFAVVVDCTVLEVRRPEGATTAAAATSSETVLSLSPV